MLDDTLKEYERLAAVYDRRWSAYIGHSTHETLKRLPRDPGQGMWVLDVGCGTGVLLEAILRRFPTVQVTGVDLSPSMLHFARQRLPDHIRLVEGPAEDLPVDDARFDLVVSCSAFHYFDRPDKALDEMKRVLKPGGQLVITDWCDDFLLCKLCDVFLRAMRKSYKKIYGMQECMHLLGEAAFKSISVERYKIDWLWGLMTVRASV